MSLATLKRAEVEDRAVKEPTFVKTGAQRVVVTHQQNGELRLRYAPIDTRSVAAEQVTAQP